MSVTIPTPAVPTAGTAPTVSGGPEAFAPLPDDVRAFSERYGLGEYLATTARMLRESFPPPGEISYRLFIDPESEEEVSWIVVAIRSQTTVPELLRYDNDFIERWIKATPAPVRDRITPHSSIV